MPKQVAGYTVTEATVVSAVRRANAFKVLQAALQGMDDPDIRTAAGIWPLVAACASPAISLAEWLTMPEQEAEALTNAAMELNPHWFVVPGDDDEKKS